MKNNASTCLNANHNALPQAQGVELELVCLNLIDFQVACMGEDLNVLGRENCLDF